MKIELTTDEKRAITALKRVAKIWPDTLWLFSASGTLCVMRYGEDGKPVYTDGTGQGGGHNPDYTVGYINIDNDGGDW